MIFLQCKTTIRKKNAAQFHPLPLRHNMNVPQYYSFRIKTAMPNT
jgi:hypothetical protein